MIKKIAILFFAYLMIFSTVFSIQVDKEFQEANLLYKNKKYKDAVEKYENILNSDYSSAEIFYNLGNSYFKLQKIPDAILNYERAKILSPNDEDINFNLKIANLKIVDKIKPIPKIFFVQWYESVRNLFSSETWAIIFIISIWLSFGFLTIYFVVWNITLRKMAFFSTIISIIIFIFSLIFTLQQSNIETHHNHAIVFTKSVYVKSSPDETSTDLFILHEGSKIEILDKLSNWDKIKIADGHIGWVKNDSFEII